MGLRAPRHYPSRPFEFIGGPLHRTEQWVYDPGRPFVHRMMPLATWVVEAEALSPAAASYTVVVYRFVRIHYPNHTVAWWGYVLEGYWDSSMAPLRVTLGVDSIEL